MASASKRAERAAGERQAREQAEATTGARALDRRIREIEFRRMGADHRVCVGERDVAAGTVVSAILQLGRDAFTIHHRDAEEALQAPTVLSRADVYGVTEYE